MNNYYKYQMPSMDMNYISDPNTMMYDMNVPNTSNYIISSNQSRMLDPYQGFIRGNMFDSLYSKYKDYGIPEVKPTSEKTDLLQRIQEYDFAMNDLNLYLDIYPNDAEMIRKYNEYRNMKNRLMTQYQNMYGPLTLDSDALNSNNWSWLNSPWSWEAQR